MTRPTAPRPANIGVPHPHLDLPVVSGVAASTMAKAS